MSIEKFVKAEMETEDQIKEQAPTDDSFIDYDSECHSMVCGGCSCLCDDISYYVKRGEIVRTLNLCEVAMKRLRAIRSEDRLPPLPVEDFDSKIKQAADILKNNGRCLVLGADGLDD